MEKENNIIEILELIKKFSSDNPKQRFTQILFNLNINQFDKNSHLMNLRDNYNDTDCDIIKRIELRLKDIEKK